jgi:hypothetical protein
VFPEQAVEEHGGAPKFETLPAALGQPQNWVGAGVAVRVFNPVGKTAPLVVALAVLAALKVAVAFAAAYETPASTALPTCIVS